MARAADRAVSGGRLRTLGGHPQGGRRVFRAVRHYHAGFHGERVPEIGYLLARKYWHMGYATEAARACKQYAFETLGLPAVYSIIRENNLPSRRVAERNGMRVVDTLVKHYYGFVMPHLVYRVEKQIRAFTAPE